MGSISFYPMQIRVVLRMAVVRILNCENNESLPFISSPVVRSFLKDIYKLFIPSRSLTLG